MTAEELRDLSMHGIETFGALKYALERRRNSLATGCESGIDIIFDKLGMSVR